MNTGRCGVTWRSLFLHVLAFLILTGCTTSAGADKAPPKPTRLVIAKDRNGVQMQFKSEEGLRYTIYYRDQGAARDAWNQLPNAVEIKGTGDLIQVSDPSRLAHSREYTIHSLVPVRRKDLKKK